MKELKLYKHKKEDDAYLLGYLNNKDLIGILLNDIYRFFKKGEFSTSWNESAFKECSDITGNISISSSNVADVYLDRNINPVMKCSRDIYILINEMEEYKGVVLEDLTKVDKVIIKI